jgi:hypothetical protein
MSYIKIPAMTNSACWILEQHNKTNNFAYCHAVQGAKASTALLLLLAFFPTTFCLRKCSLSLKMSFIKMTSTA